MRDGVGQDRPADGVDDAAVDRLLERAAGLAQALPGDHGIGAELPEVVAELVGAPGQRRDLEARGREQHGRDRADATRRTGHQHRAVAGGDALHDEPQHRQRGRVPGGAEGRRTFRGDSVGQPDGQVRVRAGERRVAAVLRLRQPGAVQDQPVSRGPSLVRRLDDAAHKVDAGDERPLPDHARAAGDGQGVLVVEVRVDHLDEDPLVSQQLLAALLEGHTVVPHHDSTHAHHPNRSRRRDGAAGQSAWACAAWSAFSFAGHQMAGPMS